MEVLATNFSFFDENFQTRKKIIRHFFDSQKFKMGNCFSMLSSVTKPLYNTTELAKKK